MAHCFFLSSKGRSQLSKPTTSDELLPSARQPPRCVGVGMRLSPPPRYSLPPFPVPPSTWDISRKNLRNFVWPAVVFARHKLHAHIRCSRKPCLSPLYRVAYPLSPYVFARNFIRSIFWPAVVLARRKGRTDSRCNRKPRPSFLSPLISCLLSPFPS